MVLRSLKSCIQFAKAIVSANLRTLETVSYTHLSTSHSINRPTYSLQDVDGDGYLDIVESEKESELKVTRLSLIHI